MKTIRTNLFGILLLILAIGFSSCVKDDFDTPPVIIPQVNFKATTTIAQLKLMHNAGALDSIKSDTIIVKGIVVANDESGNFYKTIEIEDATSGIELKLDRTNLYTQFKLGQEVYIKCKGLMLGDYNGLPQIGYTYNGAIGRIPDALIDQHLFLNGLPGKVPAPDTITIPAVSNQYISRLVILKNVHFNEIGQVYADIPPLSTSATNRTIVDASGNTLTLRTSAYANFAPSVIPSGTGDVRGILSIYGSTWQFYIRDLNDLVNWHVDNSTKILEEKFASDLGTFSAFSVNGNQIWGQYTTPGGIGCAKMTGYVSASQSDANEDWLISPALNLSLYSGTKLSFQSAMKFGTTGDGTLKVYYSTNFTGSGDPTTAAWTEITGATLPAGADWNFVASGDLDLSFLHVNNVYVAFKYTCGTTNVPTWEVTNVVVKGTHLK